MKLIQSLTLVLSIVLLLLSTTAHSMGWADWDDTTPGGNEIYNAGATTLHLDNGKRIEQPQSWYFYKDHVIGIQAPEDQVEGYFIVNEQTNAVQRFKSKAKWKTHLSEQDLTPRLWTRWYNYEWTITLDDVTMGLALSLVYLIPLGIIFAVVLAVVSFRAVTANKNNRDVKPFNPAFAVNVS